MTTKMIQSNADTASYLQDLAEEGNTLRRGLELLINRFELPPLQQQALSEAAEQLGRVITTIEGAK